MEPVSIQHRQKLFHQLGINPNSTRFRSNLDKRQLTIRRVARVLDKHTSRLPPGRVDALRAELHDLLDRMPSDTEVKALANMELSAEVKTTCRQRGRS